MPDLFYTLAARIHGDRRLVVFLIAFGILGTPLLVAVLDEGQLYGVALMAASWWPIVLLVWFHPQRRARAFAAEEWFYAGILDGLALGVVLILWLAASKA
jgi:hypothetical protein